MEHLDDVDRGVLHQLQLDARNTPASEIAEQVGVSSSTVRNRIGNLEAEGVIEGYHPKIDYEAAGLPLQILFVCSASPTERGDLVDRILDVRGVVDIRETVTGRRNLYVEAVGTDTSDAVRVTDALHEAGVEIEASEIIRRHHVQPFNHFGADEHEGSGERGAPTDEEAAPGQESGAPGQESGAPDREGGAWSEE